MTLYNEAPNAATLVGALRTIAWECDVGGHTEIARAALRAAAPSSGTRSGWDKNGTWQGYAAPSSGEQREMAWCVNCGADPDVRVTGAAPSSAAAEPVQDDALAALIQRIGIAGIYDTFRSVYDAAEQMGQYIQEVQDAAGDSAPEIEGASLADVIRTLASRLRTVPAAPSEADVNTDEALLWDGFESCDAAVIRQAEVPHDVARAGEPDGVALIAAERRRQVEVEGWLPEHDDAQREGSLALAAACYAIPAPCRERKVGHSGAFDATVYVLKMLWPWSWGGWKPTDDRIRELVKAGALIVAEIERLQRSSVRYGFSPAQDAAEPVRGL